jgi:hypothetical protein
LGVALAATSLLAGGLVSVSAHAQTGERTVPSTAPAAKPLGRQDGIPSPPPPTSKGVVVNPELVEKVAAAQPGTVLAAGTLVDDSGRPVAHAWIRADLEPNRKITNSQPPGSGAVMLSLATATTDANGRFELRAPDLVDPYDGFVEDDGTASLMIGSFGAMHGLIYHLQVRPPTRTGANWTLAEVDKKVLDTSKTISRLSTKALRARGLSRLRLTAYRQRAQAGRSSINPGKYCRYGWKWDRADGIGDRERRWINIQRMHTDNQTRESYTWSNTQNVVVETAANLGANGSLVAGAFSKAQTSSAGVTFRIPAFTYVDAQVEFTFYPYHLSCADPITNDFHYSGKFEWRPYQFTIGNRMVEPYTRIFACNLMNATTISSESWVARTSSFTYAHGLSFFGLSLNSRQTNSSEHKLTYYPSSSTGVCGNDAPPVAASQVRER